MSDKRLFLKVKLKSLAAEARIIRKEELKLLPPRLPAALDPVTSSDEEITANLLEHERILQIRQGWSYNHHKREQLYLHRTHDVRDESRATLLAYGFLRGQKYREIENCALSPVSGNTRLIGRMVAMVGKYGERRLPDPEIKALVTAWLEADSPPPG